MYKKNIFSIMLVCSVMFNSMFANSVMASEDYEDNYYISLPEEECVQISAADDVTEEECVQISAAPDVTEEMCDYSYWLDKSAADSKKLMMDYAAIDKLNLSALNASGSNMNDLVNMNETYNAKTLGVSLSNISTSKSILYVNQQSVSANEYYQSIKNDIAATVYTEESRNVQYAVAVKQTEINSIPTNAYIGYSQTDTDNEVVNSALAVNEPFIIKQRCISGGHTYYWGYADNCTGWVDADALALCENKSEWLEAWQIEGDKEDFIVVTQDKIVLEPSYYKPEISEVKLTIGTILKKVPEELIPDYIDYRGKWNNYVVYLPVRNADGKYQREIALISQHYTVSEGFLKLTKENILKLAFTCLGNRYGWGGMLDAMDCSLYTRNIYKCFGVFLPRNTNWQQTIPDTKISLAEMSDEEKAKKIKELPAGALLYFPGHTMIYIGNDGDKLYVLSALGSVAEPTGELKVQKIYSVALNTLEVRRANGSTWLHNLQSAVCPFGIGDWEENTEDDSENKAEENIEDNTEKNTEGIQIPVPDIKNKITPLNGEIYAAEDDTIAIDAFYNKINKLYIDFARIDNERLKDNQLKATVIAGSRIYTKAAVSRVQCDKNIGKAVINKKTGIAAVKLKASGEVVYELKDGNKYVVYYAVEKPKANAAFKQLEKGKGLRTIKVSELFGTAITAGRLEIAADKNASARLEGNTLIIDTDKPNAINLKYQFLNKKYRIKIKVK